MDRYNPGPWDPWPPEYWDQEANDLWNSCAEFRDRTPVNSRDPWLTEYWDQQPVDPRDTWPPEHCDQQPFDPINPFPSEYWEQQQVDHRGAFPSESWNQQPTYPRDSWQPKSMDQQSTDHPNPWFRKHRDQHSNCLNNSKSQECYQQSLESRSYLLHEPGFKHTFQKDSAYHPYQRRDQMISYHQRKQKASCSHSKSPRDSALKHHTKALVRNCTNIKAVSIDTCNTKPVSNKASTTTSNAANERALENPKDSLQEQVGNNDTSSEEVHYLYTVDPNEGKLVELVDLSENSQISENQGLLATESNMSHMPENLNYDASDLTTLKDSACDDSTNTLLNKEKNYTEKNTQEIQSECGVAYCDICNKSYEELHNSKCDLYIARCGHLFCVLCIPKLKMKGKCIKCQNAVLNLRKIFL